MKTTTLKQERQTRQLNLQSSVCKLLQMSDEQMNQLMFETACTYMEALAGDTVAQEFLAEPMFWKWWKQQWALIDEAFLHQASQAPLSLPTMRSWYHKRHREIDTYPDTIIWEKVHNSYQQMVWKVIEKHTA